jgi:hypothetical protein
VPARDLTAAFEAWAREEGSASRIEDLRARLRQHGCSTLVRKVDGRAVRGWRGVRLRSGDAHDGF